MSGFMDAGLLTQPLNRRTVLRHAANGVGALAAIGTPVNALAALAAPKTPRELSFFNLHTGERLKAEYWSGGKYNQDALHAISVLLRDYRNNKMHAIDPALLDAIHVLHDRVRSAEPFHVISGYRSPETNAMLHEASGAVAKNSFHIQGKAIDIRLPGLGLKHLQNAALDLRAGGVGYYPSDDFIHVDTGPIRRW